MQDRRRENDGWRGLILSFAGLTLRRGWARSSSELEVGGWATSHRLLEGNRQGSKPHHQLTSKTLSSFNMGRQIKPSVVFYKNSTLCKLLISSDLFGVELKMVLLQFATKKEVLGKMVAQHGMRGNGASRAGWFVVRPQLPHVTPSRFFPGIHQAPQSPIPLAGSYAHLDPLSE